MKEEKVIEPVKRQVIPNPTGKGGFKDHPERRWQPSSVQSQHELHHLRQGRVGLLYGDSEAYSEG